MIGKHVPGLIFNGIIVKMLSIDSDRFIHKHFMIYETV